MTRLRILLNTLIILTFSFIASGDLCAIDNNYKPARNDIPEMFSDIFNPVPESEIYWVPDEPESGKTWSVLIEQSRSFFRNAPSETAPVIMMAGYMDTDISWRYGGNLSMLAWVWDIDDDVDVVEIYFEGEPTGVFLHDDGNSGDFEAGDSLFGISIEIPPKTVTPGDYQLELRAHDFMDNYSDLWPYLTIHD